MDAIRYVVRWFIRFIVLWLVDAIALIIAAGILPGMSIQVPDLGSYIVVAAAVAFTLGIVNLLLRPLILLLALPLGVLVTVIIGFFAIYKKIGLHAGHRQPAAPAADPAAGAAARASSSPSASGSLPMRSLCSSPRG